jgi:hypothetical protein
VRRFPGNNWYVCSKEHGGSGKSNGEASNTAGDKCPLRRILLGSGLGGSGTCCRIGAEWNQCRRTGASSDVGRGGVNERLVLEEDVWSI